MMNKEKKTEGLEMTVKQLGKYLVWEKTKLIIPLVTVYDKLDTGVKKSKRGYACRYNCSAVTFYCCF